ncbi:MAG: DEAD/DEAH box helicase, partial [Chloroflexota bacterium]|nr:DEAD/DEAH box helicase [Chloroflexota bacterium]MDE2683456.1 DEAD/DEAH box helicase [Chloroflexota bacterium]
MIDIGNITAQLTERDALRDSDTIKTGVVERIQPQHADSWPTQLDSYVRDAMASVGISQPYQHQADAIARSLDGVDVVMESPTASGKTLAFTAPMLHSLVRNEGAHALMIYPMKALAFDQREQIRQVCEPMSVESWPYDGDTPDDIKKMLRDNPPHILLTNPEYLNMSFLAWAGLWENFLRNLRYVVIDEMHEYRGFFGGNMALLLRRFFLHLNRIGATPRVFLSTATCANPAEHAKNLTGRDVEVISARNVLRPKRHFMFVKPDIPDFRYRDILQLRVEQAALTMLSEGLQTLIFCPSKRFLEDAFRNCQRKATELGLDPEQLSAFHADLKNDQRQDIQKKIKENNIGVVFRAYPNNPAALRVMRAQAK